MASHHIPSTYEEAIGLTHMQLGCQAQNTFDKAHTRQRSTSDIYVSDLSVWKHQIAQLLPAQLACP
ncbi:MAG: hypothetical protein KC587_17730 [Nitrospira sp.]|nr:hypothetical protein [Nitrospira sp.]MCA9473755.1 hypothetical protein [Nitrospira sp.]MCW5784054.1 hypothetical protein [Nitrospirales bacterium]